VENAAITGQLQVIYRGLQAKMNQFMKIYKNIELLIEYQTKASQYTSYSPSRT
jgi:hypothetical protein